MKPSKARRIFKDDDLAVFDCAFKPVSGSRTIHYMGHVKMMGAVQPFISGAISKTINMPTDATVEDIMHAYMESWKLGSRRWRSTATDRTNSATEYFERIKMRRRLKWRRVTKRDRYGASCPTSGGRSPTSSISRA